MTGELSAAQETTQFFSLGKMACVLVVVTFRSSTPTVCLLQLFLSHGQNPLVAGLSIGHLLRRLL